jgi:hypothetical protein
MLDAFARFALHRRTPAPGGILPLMLSFKP